MTLPESLNVQAASTAATGGGSFSVIGGGSGLGGGKYGWLLYVALAMVALIWLARRA